MTVTYSQIATQTLGSAAADVTFTGISGSYTDLVLVINGSTSTTSQFRLRVGNGSIDTGSNYSDTQIYGYGTGQGSGRNSNNTSAYIAASSTGNSTNLIHFMNYSNTTTNKTILHSGGDTTAGQVEANVILWRSTSAINQIRIITNGGNLASGTTFSLYGIKAE